VPPQFSTDMENKIASYMEKGQLKFSDSMVMNFFLVLLVQIFWSRMNDFSFLTVNTMISLSVPGIVQMFQSVLYNLVYMDILMTDKWLPKLLYGG
jgi:hypothetical protein